MKLHYSQTLPIKHLTCTVFYYLMKLHYSQTIVDSLFDTPWFYYLMKLHYSQTAHVAKSTDTGFTTL